MIVKFHARGVGRGSGPVEYLLGKNHDRDGATLDRGDPGEVQALIDSSPYAKKYTSGVLSFEEADLDRATKDKLMSSFEKALLPGLDADQYSCLWVEHRDKGRLELNFVVPNVELLSGKRLQPYFDRADRPRINAWKTGMNASLGLHDPDDPKNKRELVTPRNLPPSKQDAARAITDGLLSLADSGDLTNRQDVVNALENSGFTVARQTAKSISIADPDGGRNIRLKGMIYEQDFRYGEGLREEIEAASARYGAQSQERIRAAREVYRRGIEIKRAENQSRYKRPESSYERFSAQDMALDGVKHRYRAGIDDGRSMVAGNEDPRQLAEHQPTERDNQTTRGQGRKNQADNLQRQRQETSLRESRLGEGVFRGQQQERRMGDTRGVLENDRTGKTAIERLREFTGAARAATQRLCKGLQQLTSDVRNYFERERDITPGSEQLERASQQLERTAPAVGDALQKEQQMSRGNDRDFGLHL
jgi:hypothetical protein